MNNVQAQEWSLISGYLHLSCLYYLYMRTKGKIITYQLVLFRNRCAPISHVMLTLVRAAYSVAFPSSLQFFDELS